MRYERNSRKLIQIVQADGWVIIAVTGSHHQFVHPTKTGKVTVPHPKKDIAVGTVAAIYKQAGLKP